MKNERVGILAQARISSTRLPGKVLLPFHRGQSMLEIILTRLKNDLPEAPLLVATSVLAADDPIATCAAGMGIDHFRGEETDVLKRFIDAAATRGFEGVIRVCCDNPFLLSGPVSRLLNDAHLYPDADYISFRDINLTPSIKTHWGLFAEYVKVSALHEVTRRTEENLYREHVTNFIYGNTDIFNVRFIPAPDELLARTDLRFTIDTPADFEACQKLYSLLMERNRHFSLNDLILLTDEHPELKFIMKSGIENFRK